MVQLVFVHGVNTREDDRNYSEGVANRNKLFTDVAFAGRASQIENPAWGDQAQKWAWHEASLPGKADRKKVESFSLMGGLGAAPAGEGASPLAELAKVDFSSAIDTLFVAMVEEANAAGNQLSDEQIADFAAAARHFERVDPDQPPPQRADLADNDAYVAAVRETIRAPGAFGLGDMLAEAADAVVGRARNIVSTGLVDQFRDDLNPMFGRFLGDVFVYLKAGAQRKAIRDKIRPTLIAAHDRAKAQNEALVVLGHSMGGVILYDMLTDPDGAGLPAGFRVDVLATVGSQVGLFEEFKVYASSSPAYSAANNNKVPHPATVDSWINVFDPVDLLSFRCEPVFKGVKDYVFSSATGLVSAHSAYFKRPKFHARLKVRLDELVAK